MSDAATCPKPVAGNTKERIRTAARELFLEQGIQNTSLRQIADRLGITKPALYYHFTSRDELVRSIVQPILEEMEDFVAGCRSDDAHELLTKYFELIWRHRDVLGMLVRELTALAYLDLGARMFAWRRELVELLLGPDHLPCQEIHATVALGGLADCCVEYAHLPVETVREAALTSASRALGLAPAPAYDEDGRDRMPD